jgi:hypothetical protein
MLKERGYPGVADHVRRVVGRFRPKKPAEAFQRLRTMPGEQAQLLTQDLPALLPGAAMPFFVRGHVQAIAEWGGVPRVLLYDNLKSAVVERRGDAIRLGLTLVHCVCPARLPSRHPVPPAAPDSHRRTPCRTMPTPLVTTTPRHEDQSDVPNRTP